MFKKYFLFIFVILVLCINTTHAELDLNDWFAVGTIGYHTALETGFVGGTIYGGHSLTNYGGGLLASLEYSESSMESLGFTFDTEILLLNLSPSYLYKSGDNIYILSAGISLVSVSVESFGETAGGYTAGISYIYKFKNPLRFYLHARIQGEGVMISTGLGF